MVFTEEQLLLQKKARDFAENEVRPRLDEILECETFIPRDLFKRMGELGFTGIMVPKELGGYGAGTVEFLIVSEELAKVAPTLGLILMCIAPGIAGYADSKEFCDKYLPGLLAGDMVFSGAATDPVGHANYAQWPTFGVRDGESYILNGTKLFVTNANACDLLQVWGLDDEGVMRIWVVEGDAAGLDHSFPEAKFGMRGSGGATVSFKDVRVPASMTFAGDHGLPDVYDIFWLSCAAISVGAARGALDMAIDYAKKRTFNFKPVISIQYMAERIANLETKIQAARALTYDAAVKFDDPSLHQESLLLCRSAKVFAPNAAFEVTREVTKLHGGLGYSDVRIWHYFADCVACMIADMTTEQILENIASTMGLATKLY